MRRYILQAAIAAALWLPASASAAAYTSAASGNWSSASTWTPTPPAGGPGSGDVVTIGNGAYGTPTAAPTLAATGGGSATSLPTGTYRVLYTVVNGTTGAESGASPGTGAVSLTGDTSTPLVTFPSAPPSGYTYNLYLTNTGGSVGTQHLYATGISGSTYNPTSASWTNGTTTYSAAASYPISSAIGFSNAGNANGLTLAPGTSLTVLGDVIMQASYNKACTLTLSAGSSLVLKPASGVQNRIDCADLGSSYPTVVANGTSGSRCTLKTDLSLGGTAGYIRTGTANATQGLIAASYADFANLGTTSVVGVQAKTDTPTTQAVSITNCTFTACTFGATLGYNVSWDGNLTFQYNKFANSTVGVTIEGYTSACAGFGFKADPTTGTRVVDSNVFDQWVCNGSFKRCKFTNNLAGAVTFLTGSDWPDDSYLAGNVLYGSGPTTVLILSPGGPYRDCYLYATAADNPHYAGVPGGTGSYTLSGLIFEGSHVPATNGGDGILTPGTSVSGASYAIRNCITLPIAGQPNYAAGVLFTYFCTTTGATLSAEHCTLYTGDQPGAAYDEPGTSSLATGAISSYRGNLIWCASKTAMSYKIWASGNTTSGGNQDIVSPANADYNGCYNVHVEEPSIFGGNTYTYAGNGYQGNFSAYPGAHDVNNVNPGFVDSSRNLGKWGSTVGGDGTAAGAVAVLAATPANLAANIASLLAYVRAGFRPTNPAYRAASYPGDTSSADAAGNPWPDGSPGIGAMAVQVTANPAAILPAASSAPRRDRGLAGFDLRHYLDRPVASLGAGRIVRRPRKAA